MSVFQQISQLVSDPAPGYVFELSEAGIAFATGGETGFLPLAAGTLEVSPVDDNVRKPEAVTAALMSIAPLDDLKKRAGSKKRRRAALILPDYAARVNVLDFDSFPTSSEEQLALIRFRLKKTLPFDIDSAAVSYYAQRPKGDGDKIEVVAVIVALSVIARYEALLRGMNFHAGEVTTSALAALNLYHGAAHMNAPEQGSISVIAKLGGNVLTVMVIAGGTLKLFRCVALAQAVQDQVTEAEVLSVLQPTFSYVEDELGAPAGRLILCGFRDGALPGLAGMRGELSSRFGTPGAYNAGLLGYLEGLRNG
jgi:type IV pilus assembly protein PilM